MLFTGLCGTASIAVAKDGKITKRAFYYGNYKFWRAGAVNAPRIGSYGKKKRSTGIDIHHAVPTSSVSGKIKQSGVYSISSKELKRWRASVDNLQYADVNGSGSVGQARSKNVKLKLVYLTIDNSPLIKALNKNSKAKKFMKKNNSRVVSSVWIVVSARVAQTLRTAGSLSVSYKGKNMSIKASGGGSSSSQSTVNIPSGAVFAYMIDKAKWNKKRRKKTTIRALEDDQVGLR